MTSLTIPYPGGSWCSSSYAWDVLAVGEFIVEGGGDDDAAVSSLEASYPGGYLAPNLDKPGGYLVPSLEKSLKLAAPKPQKVLAPNQLPQKLYLLPNL